MGLDPSPPPLCTMRLHSTNYHAHVHVQGIPDTVNMHACIHISMSGTSMGEKATRNEAWVCVCASVSVCLYVRARASVCVFMCVCVPASNVKSVHCLLARVRVSLRVKFNKGVSAHPYTHLRKQKYINTHTNKPTAQARAICVSPSILTAQKVKLSQHIHPISARKTHAYISHTYPPHVRVRVQGTYTDMCAHPSKNILCEMREMYTHSKCLYTHS